MVAEQLRSNKVQQGGSPMLRRINWLALLLLALSLTVVAEAQTLRDAAAARGLRIGAAVNMNPFRNEPIYTQTLGREFNILVAENAMKFDAMHPAQNTYNFTDRSEERRVGKESR